MVDPNDLLPAPLSRVTVESCDYASRVYVKFRGGPEIHGIVGLSL